MAADRALVARLVSRRSVRQGTVWGLVFAAVIVSSAYGYAAAYPTAAERARLAASLGGSAGLQALLGQGWRLDTVGGFTAWRSVGLLSLLGAIWGLLAGTRLLRGEEEAGRWELLLSGPVTRGRAAAQAVAGLAAGWLALTAVTAAATAVAGRWTDPRIAVPAATFTALACTASAAVFLAVGALASQLATSRRASSMVAAGVFGVALLVRVVADSTLDAAWARWLTPLGWPEQARALTGSRPLALLPAAIAAVVLAGVAVALAARRDVASGALAPARTPRPRLRLLGSPIGLAARLAGPIGLAWLGGLATLGLLFGAIADSAAKATAGSSQMRQMLARIGGSGNGTSAYLSVTFVITATLLCVLAAGQVVAAREEEADGRLDALLARPVGRLWWLTGRLLVAAALVVGCGMLAAASAWLGAAAHPGGPVLGRMVQAGLAAAGPGLFLLGVGALGYACWPRRAATVVYALVAWSYLAQFVGSLLRTNHWLLDTSLLHHLAAAPAVAPDWLSAGVLVGGGVLAAAVATVRFTRRDIQAG